MNQLIVKLLYLFLLLGALLAKGQTMSKLIVPYNNFNIQLDGKLNDWPENNTYHFSTIGNADTNYCSLQLLWDDEYLYIAIKVLDRYLVALEPADNPDRLHLNDGFEIYIDPLNDSQNLFDVNDIQLIFDVNGGEALFRGDRLNETLNHKVPKDTRVAKIIYEVHVRYEGTINNNTDNDVGYIVECKIPMAVMGIVPSKGMVFKADFCINDNDTLLDMSTVPEGPVHNYSSTSIMGYSDFGFPQQWPLLTLEGSAGLKKKSIALIASHGITLLFFLVLSIMAGATGFYLWVNTLKKIPNRITQKDEPLVQYLTNATLAATSKNDLHPYISKAREMVLLKPDDPFRAEDLAGNLATSVRQLQRVFRAELQTSPKVFIITVKLEMAAQMLVNESLTVSEVAYGLGFSDPSYFSKVFRKYYGQTPSEYQSSIRKN